MLRELIGFFRRHLWPVTVIDETLDSLSSVSHADQVALSRMILNLRRERNNRMPMNRTPVEIMTFIFKLAGYADNFSDQHRYYTTLNISQTCSTWRTVALRCPNIWTQISLTLMSEPIAALFAQRSAGCLLSIEDQDLRRSSPYLETFIRTHSRRAVSLKLRLVNDIPSYFVSCLPYDQLEELYLTMPWFPEDIICHDMPRLRRLVLHSFDFTASPTSLPSLTCLKMCIDDRERSSLLMALEVLRAAPCLQSVFLEKYQDSPRARFQPYDRSRINLYSVQDIDIRLEEKDMFLISSAIVLPPSAAVTMVLQNEPRRIARCFTGDAQSLPMLYNFTTVVVSKGEGVGYASNPWKVTLSATRKSVSTCRDTSSVTIHLGQTHWKNSSDHLQEILRIPFQSNTGNVTYLSFEYLRFFSHDQQDKTYHNLLNSLPTLQLIRLVACPRSSLDSLGRALERSTSQNRVSLELLGMSVSTTTLLDVCRINRSRLRNEEIILHDCKLQSEERHTGWSGDLSVIRSLIIKVKLVGNTISLSQPPEDTFTSS